MPLDELANLFEVVKETGEGWKANCPRCGDDKMKLYWNVDKNVGCCQHMDCDWSPKKGGVGERELREAMKADSPVHTRVLEKDKEIGDVTLPEEYRPLFKLRRGLREAIYSYLEVRHLKRKVLDMARVGYCESGRYWGYIIFPVFDEDGEAIYWQGRRFKKRNPKFYNPSCTYKTELLYALGSKHPRMAVVVESAINALTLFQRPELHRQVVFIVFGKTLSDQQLKKIREYKSLREVVVALDGDAWKEEVVMAKKLHGIMPDVKLCRLDYDDDLNSIGRARAWDHIFKAQSYDPRSHVKVSQ